MIFDAPQVATTIPDRRRSQTGNLFRVLDDMYVIEFTCLLLVDYWTCYQLVTYSHYLTLIRGG